MNHVKHSRSSTSGGCVAVTVGGIGKLWLVSDEVEADIHPLIQYGDGIASNPDHIATRWRPWEASYILRREGCLELAERCDHVSRTLGQQRMVLWKEMSSEVFETFLSLAQPILSDPQEICDQVRHDRNTYVQEYKTMENQKPTTAADAKPAAAPKAPAEPKVKKIAGFTMDQKISMGKNDDGKAYGKDNNPKREGSKSAARFALYKDGMTIQAALDAGLDAGDIKNDSDKGFILVA